MSYAHLTDPNIKNIFPLNRNKYLLLNHLVENVFLYCLRLIELKTF